MPEHAAVKNSNKEKEFVFDARITEVYYARITIKAKSEKEARELIDSREFDWHDDVKSGDTESTSIENVSRRSMLERR